MGIRSFRNKATEDINYGRTTKAALKLLSKLLPRKAQLTLARLSSASSLQDLKELRGNRFESLRGDRAGQYSIRINNQYRVCFRWEEENVDDVEIVDYHC